MAVPHIYSIVNCKTCAAAIDIEYLGPARNVRLAGTVRNPGQIRCMACGGSHRYSERDTKLAVKDRPPSRNR